MTADDRDPRIHDLLERHTPVQRGDADWGRVVGRPPRRAFLRPVIATAGVGVLVALIAVMFIVAPRGSDPSPAAPAFADRTEPGVALRLRVTAPPETGVSEADAPQLAADALQARASAEGFRLLTRANGDGTLDLWVPVSRTSAEVEPLITPFGAVLHDLRSAVATSTTPDDVLRVAERQAPRGRGSRLYLTTTRDPRVIVGPAPDLTALLGRLGPTRDGAARTEVPPGFELRYVPEGWLMLADRRGTYRLVRSRPALGVPDIAGIEVAGRMITVRLTPSGIDRWRTLRERGTDSLALFPFGWPEAIVIGRLDATASTADTILIDARTDADARLIADLARSPLPVELTVEAERGTGPGRERRGVAGLPVPAALKRYLDPAWVFPGEQPLLETSLLRVLTYRAKYGEWSIWTGVDRGGGAFEALIDPRPVVGGAAISRGGGGPGCVLSRSAAPARTTSSAA